MLPPRGLSIKSAAPCRRAKRKHKVLHRILQNSRTDPELVQSSRRALQNPEGFNPPYLPPAPRIAPVWRSILFWFSTFFPTCFLARFSENPGSPKVAKKHRKRRVGISARAPEASRRPRALPTVTEALRGRFSEARGSLRTPFWRPKREVPTLTKAWPQRIGSTFSGFQRGSRKKERKNAKIQVEIKAFSGRNRSRRASQTSPVRPRGPKMASGGGPGTHPKIDEFSGNGKVRKKAVRWFPRKGSAVLRRPPGR